MPTPPPTYTIGLPTPAPTLTAIPDTNLVDQSLAAERDTLLAQVQALPALTGTLVSGLTGGQLTSADGVLTLGLLPGVVPFTDTLTVHVAAHTFAPGDPRATRNGQPLAYTYELTATQGLTGAPLTHFRNEVTLVWTLDPAVLATAGITGFPYHVYTYNETGGFWEEVLSRWQPDTRQLVVTTPHFSLYAIGSGFDVVNNYVPSVNNFETTLQSGTAAINYPINVPAGPGGFAPKVTLSYNSGNIDRVSADQQGSSSVGWGWSLSMSYIAATQHHYGSSPTATGTPTYHPWTASIVSDGANGDLVKGQETDPTTGLAVWHTAEESYAKIEYDPTADRWDAWGTDGTHYAFSQRAQVWDQYANAWVTSRWLLDTATDVHNNKITYTYKYEGDSVVSPTALPTTPPVNARTRSVYPYLITYGYTHEVGGDVDKLQVQFNLDYRTIGTTFDRSDADRDNGLYQSYRVTRIEVRRRQASNSYTILRAYDLNQDYSIQLPGPPPNPTTTPPVYPHLTLNSIIPHGQGGTSQLPSTTFVYAGASTGHPQEDWGHLWWANNGYGGSVGFYYDAAGADISSWYRRVRAKVVKDGLGETPPHRVVYRYTYRGALDNDDAISDEAALSKPLHAPNSQFRGFGWAEVQDPALQVTDHFYSQDDTYKAQEWRVQTGKADVYTTTMDLAPTQTPNPAWTITGQAAGYTDPEATPSVSPTPTVNMVWKLNDPNTALTRQGTVPDGADVSVRLLVQSTDSSQSFTGAWKLENANGNGDYWGLQIYSVGPAPYTLKARVVWSVGGVSGSRDLNEGAPNRPQLTRPLAITTRWYRLRLHTSPDGRFALELNREASYNQSAYSDGDYLQIKSTDPGDGSTIPLFPTGQTWRFKHEVTQNGSSKYRSLLDDYAETRTVYAQSDSVYSLRSIGAAPYNNNPLVGRANNCDGMTIRFVSLAASWSTTYGAWSTQPGQVQRSKTTYEYDTYGNQQAVYEYGDLAATGDERSTHAWYNTDTTHWVLNKLGWTNTYEGIRSNEGGYYFLKSLIYGYNSTWDLTSVTQANLVRGQYFSPNRVTQYSYDGYGNQTQVIDANNHTTTTGFDPFYYSFPVTVTYPNTRQALTQYDYTLDVPSVMTDVNGTRTEAQSDVFGRPLKNWTVGFGTQTNPNEQYSFPDLGASSMSAPFYISYTRLLTGATTTWQTRWFDGRGRAVLDVSPQDISLSKSIVVQTTYTDTGQVANTTLPSTVTNSSPTGYVTPVGSVDRLTTYYDGIGRTTMTLNPDNTTVVYNYDWLSIVGTRNETQTQQKWQYTDALGRLGWSGTVDVAPGGPVMSVNYGYDLLNQLTTTTRDSGGANSTVSTMTYDGLGRKSEMTDPDMGHWKYYYDAAGNLLKQEDALYLAGGHDDHQIFFTYDAMNRVTNKYYGETHYGNGNGTPDVTYYYDNALGDADAKHSWGQLRLAEVTVAGQGVSKANKHWYEYDARGLTVADVVSTNYSPRLYTTAYAYDVGGRLTTVTYPDPEQVHEQVTVGYNTQGAGLPKQLSSNKQSGPYPVLDAAYNARGQLLTLWQGSSLLTGDLLTTNFTYDDTTTKRGWLTHVLVTSNNGNATPLDMGLSYYANGNVSAITQQGNGTNNPTFTNTYQYDGLDRLKLATGTLFAQEGYSYDSLGRLTLRTIGTQSNTYSYDPNHKDAPSFYQNKEYQYDAVGNQTYRNGDGSTQTRSFDPENRLASITIGTAGGTTVSDFVYDANGQRLVSSVTVGSGTPTRTLTIGNLYEEVLAPWSGQDVSWTSGTNVTATGNTLQKTGGTYSWDDAGAVSASALTSGDGYVEVTADSTGTHRMFGLSHGDSGVSYTDIDFAMELAAGGVIKIHEGGVAVPPGSFGSYAVGDVLKVAVEGGTVVYYRNNTVLYKSTLSPTYPLLVDTSLYTPGGQLQNVRLCTGRVNPGSAYTAYYALGDKLVGLRRANQSGSNGQYRLVSDHLGSTTLLLDTANPPQVVQRQYYKPYGELAWPTNPGASLTSVNFTGQRLDSDSGLLYYGARYYDPILAFFISADPTIPSPTNPLDHNRYLYVRSNPLRYLDLLGYGPEDHYVFVNGCSGSSSSDNCGGGEPDWGEYLDYLEKMFNEGGWGLNENGTRSTSFATWAEKHVHYVHATSEGEGASNIATQIHAIAGQGNIHLLGHSMGGAAILKYLMSAKAAEERNAMNYGPVPGGAQSPGLDPRIASVAIIDSPLNNISWQDPSIGEWIAQKKINFVDVDEQGDSVNNDPIRRANGQPLDYYRDPDYSVDLNNQKRAVDFSNFTPIDWHRFTFTHVARETRTFMSWAWR